jgi:hypothetical protein
MKRKPIRINWDDLEAAFDNPNQEIVYYLDVIEGRVFLEGEDDPYEDDDESYGNVAAPAGTTPRDDTRLRIDPLDPGTKVGWMESFLERDDDLDPEFVRRTREALKSDDPTQEIVAALAESPETKDRWYRFRSDRLHERIDRWLADHGLAVTDPPPWS